MFAKLITVQDPIPRLIAVFEGTQDEKSCVFVVVLEPNRRDDLRFEYVRAQMQQIPEWEVLEVSLTDKLPKPISDTFELMDYGIVVMCFVVKRAKGWSSKQFEAQRGTAMLYRFKLIYTAKAIEALLGAHFASKT